MTMSVQIKTKGYVFDFFENSFEAKLIRQPFKSWLPIIIFFSLLDILLVISSVICFIKAGYFYAVLFLLTAIFTVYLVVQGMTVERKRLCAFRFIVNSKGVTHSDVNATYFLPWADVISYGMVNNNVISGTRDTPPYQICLYFASEIYSEKYLRKTFWRVLNRRYRHCSSEKIVTLCLLENQISDELRLKIDYYLNMFCKNSKEINYLTLKEAKPMCTVYGPQGCYATNRITADGKKVGYMYREKPDADSDFPDSGWRFFAGDETDEYSNNPDNINVFSLNTICNYDSDISPYLDAPYGSAFIREGNKFIKD